MIGIPVLQLTYFILMYYLMLFLSVISSRLQLTVNIKNFKNKFKATQSLSEYYIIQNTRRSYLKHVLINNKI